MTSEENSEAKEDKAEKLADALEPIQEENNDKAKPKEPIRAPEAE